MDDRVNIPEYQRVNLNVRVRGSLIIFFKKISHSSNRMNQIRAKILVDLFPQFANAYFNHICLRIKVIVPDMFHNHCFGNDIHARGGQASTFATLG